MFTSQKTNSNNYDEITYTYELLPITGHKEGKVIFIEYINGYLSSGTKTCICSVCENEYIEETPSADMLFEFLGYSMPEDGRNQLSVGFIINYKAIEQYETIAKTEIEYGMVLAVADQLNGKTPLESENTQKIMIQRDLNGVSLKVSGFTEKLLDLELVMAAYVIDGEKTVYLQNVQTDIPMPISINKYVEVISNSK